MVDLTLITVPTSPYGARVRIQALEKGLILKFMDPPGGMGSVELQAISPFGKVPLLQTDGQMIIESSAIQEYLEDIYPQPSLRGHTAMATARVRALVCAIDQYLFPLIFTLRQMQPHAQETAQALADIVTKLDQRLQQMTILCDGRGYLVGTGLTLADCALVPAAFYAGLFLRRHGQASPFDQHNLLRHWQETVARHASVHQTMDQITHFLAQKARG